MLAMFACGLAAAAALASVETEGARHVRAEGAARLDAGDSTQQNQALRGTSPRTRRNH
jgi:hypothetical protein